MIEAEIPKNILQHESKIIAGFSKRQILFGAPSVILGVTAFFTVFSGLGQDLRIGLSLIIMLPGLLFGFLKIYGIPLEKMIKIVIFDNFVCPPKRLYETKFSGEPVMGKKKNIKKSRKYKAIR